MYGLSKVLNSNCAAYYLDGASVTLTCHRHHCMMDHQIHHINLLNQLTSSMLHSFTQDLSFIPLNTFNRGGYNHLVWFWHPSTISQQYVGLHQENSGPVLITTPQLTSKTVINCGCEQFEGTTFTGLQEFLLQNSRSRRTAQGAFKPQGLKVIKHTTLSLGTQIVILENTTIREPYHLTKIFFHYTPAPYSLKWYNSALPLVFPITTYSLLGEKSIAVTFPNGVLCVGQFANDVSVGM